MYILAKLTYTDKEAISLYNNYSTEKELIADFETQLGQGMNSAAYKGIALIAFDHTGKIYARGSDMKDESINFLLRLLWIQSTEEGESNPNQSPKEDIHALMADYHVRKGTAMKDSSVKGALFLGLNGSDIILNDYYVNA